MTAGRLQDCPCPDSLQLGGQRLRILILDLPRQGHPIWRAAYISTSSFAHSQRIDRTPVSMQAYTSFRGVDDASALVNTHSMRLEKFLSVQVAVGLEERLFGVGLGSANAFASRSEALSLQSFAAERAIIIWLIQNAKDLGRRKVSTRLLASYCSFFFRIDRTNCRST